MANSKNIRVLLIDDNDLTREILRVLLSNDGYEVVGEAQDGEAGLEMSLKLQPDLICLDVLMPRRNGLDTLKQLATLLPKSAVLMVTANMERETVQTYMAHGASGYIIKPFNSVTILQTVTQALEQKRQALAH